MSIPGLVAIAAAFIAMPALAADDKAALQGMKEGKIVFDVTEGDGKLLLSRLGAIDETRQSMISQGVTPHFVLAFRGGATKLVQTDMEKVKPDDRQYVPQIAAMLQQMSKAPGVEGMEQCSVAIRHAGTKAENVLPIIKVVGNSFVSLMSYESKGYAYIIP
jgi:intracellular sulfur oxidation DsrE/DsrF family protein